MSGRISRFCRDLVAVFAPDPAAAPLSSASPLALLEIDEACAQDERTAKEAAMSPAEKIPAHHAARLSKAASELEAALNAYPGDVEVVIDRHRLDRMAESSPYVFEVRIEERRRLWP